MGTSSSVGKSAAGKSAPGEPARRPGKPGKQRTSRTAHEDRFEPSPSEEMYLKTFLHLEQEGTASGARLAQMMGVSPASVSAMLHRFAGRGWVHGQAGDVRLTAAGRRLALRIVRRHRLAERLFTDVLKLPWEQVHDPACALEHAVSDVVADRIDEVLDHPGTCPHGHPIPSRDGSLPREAGVALAGLRAGSRTRVVSISREDPDLLAYLGSLGIMPGAMLCVEQVAPFGGPLLVRVGRARYALGREVAGIVTVEQASAGGAN